MIDRLEQVNFISEMWKANSARNAKIELNRLQISKPIDNPPTGTRIVYTGKNHYINLLSDLESPSNNMPIYNKVYKYRLYPTYKQIKYLDQNFAATRFMWNQLVANFNNYGTDAYIKNLSEVQIKETNTWMKNCISYAIQQKRMDFHEFTKQYFNKKRKSKLGKPKFKKRGVSNDTFRIPGQAINFIKAFDFDNSTIKIPKMSPIKIKFDRIFTGLVRNVTISKTKTNEYYASVLVQEEIVPKQKSNNDIGLDLGLTHVAILSNGIKFENPKYFREKSAKLKIAQRQFSRKAKGSKRKEKQRLKVAKLHQKITRQRNWYYHQISNYLVTKFDSIFLEDLSVKNMVKNRKLAKSIADVSWSVLVGMIGYKSVWYGKEMKKVGRFFASSQLCSNCGTKSSIKHDLSIRDWICSSCGYVHDRDVNAAKNILKEGLFREHGLVPKVSEELPEYSRGEIIRPSWFVLNQSANFVEAMSNRNSNVSSA